MTGARLTTASLRNSSQSHRGAWHMRACPQVKLFLLKPY
jgi:hypothetical protein